MPAFSHTHQFVAYFIVSNVLTVLTVAPVLQRSPTFYAAGVQLSEGLSTIVLANWLVAVAVVVGKVLQQLLFGELRLIEIEHVYERSKFTVLTSLFALTMFSNDYLLIPGILTLILLFIKVFHWILKDRYEFIFQNATKPSEILLSRNTFTLLLLLYVDFSMVYSCAEYTFGNNPDVYFAFGFEFAVLFLDLFAESIKIGLNAWELSYLASHPQEEVMESKALYMKILEMSHTALKLAIHVFLVYTFMGPYRFPFYLFKDIFFNTLSLVKQIQEFNRYRKAAKELDSRLQDATEEDLRDDNNLCIICRDDMTTVGLRRGERLYPKKLRCNHIIHMGCLKGWFERSQVCPMCRAPVFAEDGTTSNQRNNQAGQAGAAQANPPPPPPPQLNFHNQVNHNHTAGHDHNDANDILNNANMHFRGQGEPQPGNTMNTANTSGAQATNTDILRLPETALIPPDWTVFKLSNTNTPAGAAKKEFTLHLSSTQTAKLERIEMPVGQATAYPIDLQQRPRTT